MNKFSVVFLTSAILLLPYQLVGKHPPSGLSKAKSRAETVSSEKLGRHTLFAGGDTMLARWVHQAYYRRGGAWMFEQVQDLTKNSDIALTNLECIVSTEGDFFEKGEGRPYLYRARPETLDILTEAGFDVVTTANNHSLDYGRVAMADQLNLLDAVGIAAVGTGKNISSAADPVYVKTGDVIIAFIGMDNTMPSFAAGDKRAGIFNTKPGPEVPNLLKKSIATARKHADLVVFTPHWGRNWTENAEPNRIRLARAIIDEGVDAILGHSAHQLHGVELYKGKLIVYDMGSLFFDTIRQKRMRLSAGFVLEFDKRGFSKLSIHPLYLSSCRVAPATGENLEKIHDMLRNLSEELDPSIEFETEGDALVLNFSPAQPPPPRQSDPPKVHTTGSTQKLSRTHRNRDSNFVVKSAPKWTENYTPVAFDHGVTLLGYHHAEAVRPKRGFVSSVAVKVDGALNGRWDSFIEARRRNDGKTFRWQHPVGDGAWQPEIWKQGQLGIDKTLFRTKLDAGVYDLFWGLRNVRSGEMAKPLQPLPPLGSPGKQIPIPEGMAPVGFIHVLAEGIPRGVAGLKWSGVLPSNLRHLRGELKPKPESAPWGLIVGISAGMILVLLGLTMIIRRRKKSSVNTVITPFNRTIKRPVDTVSTPE